MDGHKTVFGRIVCGDIDGLERSGAKNAASTDLMILSVTIHSNPFAKEQIALNSSQDDI